MSDTQKKIENEKAGACVSESESTVFSDPTAHRETAADVKKTNRGKIIIAAFLAVAVLAGSAFAINHFIDPITDDTSSDSSIESVTLWEFEESDIKSCTVENSFGTYKLISESTTENDIEVLDWYIEGYDKVHINTTSTASVINAVLKLTSTREVTKRTEDECGFDTPQAVVTVEKTDGETLTLTIGDTNFEKTGDYIKLSNNDKLYLLSPDVRLAVNVSDLSLASTNITPTFPTSNISSVYKNEEGILASFDKLVISGKNYEKAIVLEKNNNESINVAVPYNIVSPIKHYAQNQEGILEIFASGLTPTGAYAFNTEAATLEALGLASPDMQFEMTVENRTMTYKFALQEDGNYAVVCDGMTLIAKVSADDLAFKNFVATDYYYDWISVHYIDDIKQMVVKTPEKVYDFGITPDTASEDDFVVTYNGELLDSDNFKNYYGACIILSASDYDIQAVSGKADYTLTYVFKDDIGGKQTIEFFKVSETKYQYRIDGVDVGRVTSSELKKLINNTERVANGLQINNN